MRKKVYAMLAVVMAAGCLAACSVNDGKESGKDSTKANDMVEISQKKNGVKTVGEEPTSGAKNESQKEESSQGVNPDRQEEQERDANLTLQKMVMLEGEMYYGTGKESDIKGRCGMMDGSIDSSVKPNEVPQKDNQSNFGKGYSFQWVGEGSIDIYMNDLWMRFEKKAENDTMLDKGETKQDKSDFTQSGGGKWDKEKLQKSEKLTTKGFSLKIKEKKENSITAVLTNTTKKDLAYGEYFKIQVKLDGDWYDIPVDLGFHDLAHELKAGACAEENYTLKAYGDLPAGIYRLVVEEACDEFQIR